MDDDDDDDRKLKEFQTHENISSGWEMVLNKKKRKI